MQKVSFRSLIFPYDAFVLVVGIYLADLMEPNNAPVFMYSAIVRLFLAGVTFPMMLYFFQTKLIPVMDIQDEGIWKYAWPIPAALTLISALYINPYYEQAGVSSNDVLARIVTLLLTLAVCLLLFKVLKKTQEKAETEEQSRLLLDLQTKQYRELADKIEQTKAARHDLRHQLLVIENLVQNQDYDKLNEYIHNLTGNIALETPLLVCEHFAVNAIAAHYIAIAKEQGIRVWYDFGISSQVSVKNVDLCIIIGNCLENAIDACALVSKENRFIKAKARQVNKMLLITFDNSFDGNIKKQENIYYSRKRGYLDQGIGIASVKAVVAKYNGHMEIDSGGNVFRVSILL